MMHRLPEDYSRECGRWRLAFVRADFCAGRRYWFAIGPELQFGRGVRLRLPVGDVLIYRRRVVP